jgi:hypothetical protein
MATILCRQNGCYTIQTVGTVFLEPSRNWAYSNPIFLTISKTAMPDLIPLDPSLPAILPVADAEALRAFAENEKAASTRHAYARRAFSAWCASRKVPHELAAGRRGGPWSAGAAQRRQQRAESLL